MVSEECDQPFRLWVCSMARFLARRSQDLVPTRFFAPLRFATSSWDCRYQEQCLKGLKFMSFHGKPRQLHSNWSSNETERWVNYLIRVGLTTTFLGKPPTLNPLRIMSGSGSSILKRIVE